MKAAILTVGTEILFGQIVNTNTVFLSRELNNLGIDVMYHYTVGDNSARLKELIVDIQKDCDLIITTGGLGPTQDDLTKETVTDVMEDKLVYHEEIWDEIVGYFNASGKRKITENNKKQAYFPSRATVLPNERGTAPGFALKNGEKIVICLPGPPGEMTDMYEKQVVKYIKDLSEGSLYYRLIRLYGLGESDLETLLMDLIDGQTDPTLATYAKEGECYLRIASKRDTEKEAEAAVDEMLEKVRAIIGPYIYSCDNEELSQVVGRLLIEKNLTISCAESCTGGLFAKTLTDIPGISEVFDRGLVTYSNAAKREELGVRSETLGKYGAVSPETAEEMAKGLHEVTGSDICIAVTGIAGPGGGTEEKPVGLVYIATYSGNGTTVKKCNFMGNRDKIRNRAMLAMFHEIHKILGDT